MQIEVAAGNIVKHHDVDLGPKMWNGFFGPLFRKLYSVCILALCLQRGVRGSNHAESVASNSSILSCIW